ncbi:cupin domain-containing protein [Paralcaligenes sp. KSB-10]|uniref:cupin domain-containing protein n=1 Tax=Paralcaligenes sp. KSB-10 TaxID=2901142 RepID=UPI001E397CB4|nr:cupin domain-containing protein [Paralcaligenes sp. KSB-10]UHL64707.1 cupin domain-containing protein [Paralcaligenes sp. KSB-10]
MNTDATRVESLIERFQLQPHPEGGYYRETYRGGQSVRRSADGAQRSASTAIYYLLDQGAYSAWHRIASDEIWHFYAGGPLDVHVLDGKGELATYRLGNAQERADAVFQAVVPAGCWFGAELAEPQGYALVGCTVAPGFEFSEFEMAVADELLGQYPQHAKLIKRLLRPA